MAYKPVSGVVPQYQKADGTLASGYWLKGYATGTTTPLSMGIDSTPSSTLAKAKIGASGYPISDSGDETTIFIPHFNANFKLALYPTETDADNDTTANAIWVVDAIDYGESALEATVAALTDALPSGVTMAFFQAAAPTGWTQVTTQNNKMMRVVSGAGGGSGGSDSPISYSQDLSHVHAGGSMTLGRTHLPTVVGESIHGWRIDTGNATRPSDWTAGTATVTGGNFRFGENYAPDSGWDSTEVQNAVGGNAHDHGNTDSTTLTGSWAPLYIDMILAIKD